MDEKIASREQSDHASLELLYHVSRELASALELPDVLERVLRLSVENVGAISGSLIVLDERGNPMDSAIVIGDQIHEATTQQLLATFERGLAGWAARERQPALVPDTSQDQRWLIRPDDARHSGPKSAISIPILVREDLVGVMTLVHPKPGFFEKRHLSLLQAIADLAGTAIRHAQLFESLEAAHQRYRDLFEDSIDAILISELGGKILEANRQAGLLTGLKADTLQSMKISNLGVTNSELLGVDFEKVPAQQTLSYEGQLAAQAGHGVPVQIYVRRITIDGGAQLQWILRDISERKKLEAQREDLLSMIFHDLRSPLANVISSLEMLEATLPVNENPAAESVLKIASRSTQRIQRLTNTLLDIRRLEAGQPVLSRQPVRPYQLAEEAAAAIQPAGKGHRIEIEIPPNLPELWVDAEMICRVLINLLENAVKYSLPSSKIRVSARQTAEAVEMWVQDYGPGIPPEEQERIFEKYTRIETADGPKGLGLGLAYCRLAIEAHGGRIWVESQPGGGACFKYRLPAAPSTT